MKRMLKAIGLEANILPYNAAYEDIMKIPAAEYNISVCQIFADEYLFQSAELHEPYPIIVPPVIILRFVLFQPAISGSLTFICVNLRSPNPLIIAYSHFSISSKAVQLQMLSE